MRAGQVLEVVRRYEPDDRLAGAERGLRILAAGLVAAAEALSTRRNDSGNVTARARDPEGGADAGDGRAPAALREVRAVRQALPGKEPARPVLLRRLPRRRAPRAEDC